MRRRTLTLAALAAPWVARAQAARTMTVAAYSGIFQDNWIAAVIEPFTVAHPDIKVNYFSAGSSAQTLGTLRAQKAAPQIDVAVMDVSVAKAGTDEGLFDTLDGLPGLQQLSPHATTPGVAGVALTFDNLVLLYAPGVVKPAPTSWKVLWDKQYADRIAIQGVPDIVGVSTVLIANRIFGGGDYRDGVAKGIEAMAQMAPGVLTWDPKPDAYSFIINDQAALGVGWNARGQLYSGQSNGKLGVVLPEEGSLFQVNNVELVRGARQPEAARTFIEYILSPPAQTAFTNRMFYAPTNMSATPGPEALARTAASPERMAKMLDVDWLAVAKIRDRITEQWRRQVMTRR